MTEKEILEKQVEALEKLIQIKEAIIKDQEERISKLEQDAVMRPYIPQVPYTQPYIPPYQPQVPGQISIPSVWKVDPCTDGQFHDYNYPWHGTNPQPCKKCGKQAASSGWTITSSNTALLDEEIALGTITDIANKKNV